RTLQRTRGHRPAATERETNTAVVQAAPATPPIASANRIAPNWQPDQELLRRVAEHNIPEPFTRQQIPELITYWRERGEISHSWRAKFLKHVLHQWPEYQTGLA